MDCAKHLKSVYFKRPHSVRWAFDFGSWKPTEAEFIRASSCIQLEEKERIGRFVYKKDVKASLIGRLLMRKFVAITTGLPYESIVFGRDNSGKPYLQNDVKNSELMPHFNVSHQGNFTVLAGEMCKDEIKLGVDVMKLEYTGGKGLNDFFRIMSRQFSSKEWETIRGDGNNSLTPVNKDERMLSMFCRNWCLKESYVKATGTGITVDLQNISFNIPSDILSANSVTSNSTVCVGGAVLNEWIFEESLVDKNHCVAVALCKTKETHAGCTNKENLFVHLGFDDVLDESRSLIPEDLEFCNNFFLKEEKPY